MKKFRIIISILLIIIPFYLFADNNKPTIAIIGIDAKNIDKNVVSMVVVMMENAIVNSDKYRVVERRNIEAAAKELKIQSSDFFNSKTASRLGKFLGSKYVIYATLIKLDNEYTINAKIIEVESVTIIKSAVKIAKNNKELQILAGEIVEDLTGGTSISIVEEIKKKESEKKELKKRSVIKKEQEEAIKFLNELEFPIENDNELKKARKLALVLPITARDKLKDKFKSDVPLCGPMLLNTLPFGLGFLLYPLPKEKRCRAAIDRGMGIMLLSGLDFASIIMASAYAEDNSKTTQLYASIGTFIVGRLICWIYSIYYYKTRANQIENVFGIESEYDDLVQKQPNRMFYAHLNDDNNKNLIRNSFGIQIPLVNLRF